MATPGGPLLRVSDMLHDLAGDSASSKNVSLSSLTTSVSLPLKPSATQEPRPGAGNQDLAKAFEDTCNQLNVALKGSGHTWTGLTQELCATVTTADKLVATAHSNLGQLKQEVERLEAIVKRGQDSFLKLQAAIGQNTDTPLPGV